jgi:hypothetical protein
MFTSSDGQSWRQERKPGLLIYSAVYGQETFVAAARVSTNRAGIYQSDAMVPRFERNAHPGAEAFTGEIIADPGQNFVIQKSADFAIWTNIMNVTNASLRTPFTDRAPAAGTAQFYRVERFDAGQ